MPADDRLELPSATASRSLDAPRRPTPPVPPGLFAPSNETSSTILVGRDSPKQNNLPTPLNRQDSKFDTDARSNIETTQTLSRQLESKPQDYQSLALNQSREAEPDQRIIEGQRQTKQESGVQTLGEDDFPRLPSVSRMDESSKKSNVERKATPRSMLTSEKEEGSPSHEVKVEQQSQINWNPDQARIIEAEVQSTTKPSKLDIEVATGSDSADKEKQDPPYPDAPEASSDAVQDSSVTPSSASRPGTPSTAAGTPVKRNAQPRTLRVLPTPQTESQVRDSKSPANDSKEPSTDGKAPSRQPSVPSIKTAELQSTETPVEELSVTPESSSRPSSPPPSKVGSAPVRIKSKSQQKKERQERAKAEAEAEEKKNVPKDPGPLADNVIQEPITGRKKKSKKPATNVATGSSTPTISQPTTRPSSPKLETSDEIVTDHTDPSPVEPSSTKKVEAEEPQIREAESSKKQQSSPWSIISELKLSGDLDASALELFRTSGGVNYRYDVNSTDVSHWPDTVQLSDEELAQLDAGEPVRRGEEIGRTASRILFTPSRRCLRGLAKEQEERYLELEKRILATKTPLKYTHRREATDLAASTADDLSKAMAFSVLQPVTAPPVSTAQQPRTSTIYDDQPTYGDDSIAYMDQTILPPLPSRSAPSSAAKPPHPSSSAAPLSRNSSTTSLHIDSPIPRTYTTGEPTYSVTGVDVAPPPPPPPPERDAFDFLDAAVDVMGGSKTGSAIRLALQSAMSNVVGAAAAAAAASARGGGEAGEYAAMAGRLGGDAGAWDLGAVEQELAARRKECEGQEKKLAAMMKRNRKVVTGAMGVAGGS